MTAIDLYSKLQDRILKDYPSAQIYLVDVVKENESYKGIKVSFDRSYLDPVFNLDKLSKNIKSDKDLERFSYFISKEIKYAVAYSPIDFNVLNNYDKLKSLLCVDIIPIIENKELLKTVPYKPFSDDMAIIVKAVLKESPEKANKLPMVTITNEMLDIFNVEKNTLLEDALNNSEKINPPEILSISDFLYVDEYIESPETHLHENAKIPVEIITTQTGICKASPLLNEEILADLANRYDGNYYLIPSTAGCWAIPDNFMNSKELAKNIEDVLKEGIFSDNVKQIGELYHYTQDSKLLEPNRLFEERNSKLIGEQKKDIKTIIERPKTERDKELEM